MIEGSVKVESDAEALVDQFQRNASLQYIVTAETGDLGVTFSAPYTGMQLEVSEVLNQTKEDEKVQQSITRCAWSKSSSFLDGSFWLLSPLGRLPRRLDIS